MSWGEPLDTLKLQFSKCGKERFGLLDSACQREHVVSGRAHQRTQEAEDSVNAVLDRGKRRPFVSCPMLTFEPERDMREQLWATVERLDVLLSCSPSFTTVAWLGYVGASKHPAHLSLERSVRVR